MGETMSRDSFLERWSRRKLAEGREPERESEAVQPAEEPAPVDEPDEKELDEEELDQEELDQEELAKLPSLDSFTLKTDLAPFLRRGVPQALKNAAMRKMWMLDPAVRDHKDFAVDYAWDWNTPGGVPGNSGTISQDSLTRMMDALKPKARPEATVAGVPDEAEAAESPAPEAQPDAEVPQETVENDAPQPHDRAPRPRRHGGAAPV